MLQLFSFFKIFFFFVLQTHDQMSSSPSCSTVDAESISGNFYVHDFAEGDVYFQNNMSNGFEGTGGRARFYQSQPKAE